VPGTVLAIATSDNAPGGAILTFAFPIILFAVIATVLYLLLFRPHHRVPAGHVAVAPASGTVDHATAHAAAVATGMPTAAGGGLAESAAEPAGAKRDAAAAELGTNGNVTGETEQGTTEGTEATE
jgi:hypothetical protein